MAKIYLFLVLCAMSLSAKGTTLSAPHTLSELYHLALKNNPLIPSESLNIDIARSQQKQIKGNLLPAINFSTENTWKDLANSFIDRGRSRQHSTSINLSQPLFQGGSEYYALKNAKKKIEFVESQKRQREIELYRELGFNFYELLKIKKAKINLLEQKKLLQDRVSTLRKRVNIGRNKRTHLLRTEARMAKVEAQIHLATKEYLAKKLKLINTTGSPLQSAEPTNFIKEDGDAPLEFSHPLSLEKLPLIKMAKAKVKSIELEVKSLKGQFWPKLDADANYYIDKSGINKNSKWDATLKLTLNLFNGGKDRAAVAQKWYELKKAELMLKDLMRRIKNDHLSLAHQGHKQKKSITALELATSEAKKNYREHLVEISRGLISQLEVLDALDQYIELKQQLDHEKYELKKTWIAFTTLCGVTP